MSKRTVTRLFIGSLLAAASGAILAAIAVWGAIANGVFVMSGPDIVGVQGGPLAAALLVLGLIGSVAFAAGVIGGFVAWIGALLNTAQLESKTWFLVLLVLGIFNLGFLAMIAYVIAGPDGTTSAGRSPAPVSAAA